jgi:hypothetical protein
MFCSFENSKEAGRTLTALKCQGTAKLNQETGLVRSYRLLIYIEICVS